MIGIKGFVHLLSGTTNRTISPVCTAIELTSAIPAFIDMKTMHESMSKMNGMMGGGKATDPGQRMERRMDMMQMMMEHEAAGNSLLK